MTITSVQLWERIHAAGLATPDQCRKWAAEVAASSSPEKLNDPNQLAAELIRLARITPFQANVLFAELPLPLALGNFRITESLESKWGPNWYGAVDSTDPKNRQLLCYLLTSRQLATANVKSWPPSLELASSHIAVSHACLDRWLYSGIDKSCVIGISQCPQGHSLSERIAQQPLSWQSSVALLEQLASAIQKIHESGLVHGCICPDAVWCVDENEFVLRRDAIYPPSNPYSSSGNSILARSHNSRLAIAAPELTLPASCPTIHSDLYALGCVWYQSLTGQTPWRNSETWNAQDWARAHLEKTSPAFSPQQLPKPLHRCLDHLIAKNPSARFPSAASLLKAIESAVLESEKQIEQLASPMKPSLQADSVREAPAAYAINKSASLPPDINKAPAPSKQIVQPKPEIKPKPEAQPKVTSQPKAVTQPKAAGPSGTEMQPKPVAIQKPATQGTDATQPTPVEPIAAIPTISNVASSTANSPPSNKVAPNESVTIKSDPRSEVALDGNSKSIPLESPAPVNNKESAKPPDPRIDAPTSKASQAQPNFSAAANPKKKKKKSKKQKKPVWLLPAMIGGACLVFAIVIALLVQDGGKSAPAVPNTTLANNTQPDPSADKNKSTEPATNPSRTDGIASKPTSTLAEYFEIEPDNGQLLWAPPNAGSAYSLELFPAGVEAVVFLSANSYQGRGAAIGLNKWWRELQPDLLQQISSLPLLSDSRIVAVAIALYPSKNPGLPQAAFRISFAQPVTVESIVEQAPAYKLKLFDPKNGNKKGYWSNEPQNNSMSIVVDELQTDLAVSVKRAVIGPTELLAALPELNGSPAPLRRQLETLLKSTDSRSDLCILAAPSFLFGDGRELVSANPKLQDALRDTIDESVQAMAFATSFEPRWYLELRMLSSDTRELGKLASALKSRLTGLPDSFEQALSTGMELHPYWRALGLRYPQMLRTFAKYLRVGLEDGQVVANVYLPSDALNNVAISSWMALHPSTSSIKSSVATKPPATTKPANKSIEEILDAKISISFDQESLEAALQLIAGEVSDPFQGNNPISMSIDGASFQKEGITRNQSIRDFKQVGVPLRVVLTDLVRRANPVTTVQSPTEKNQKVVWLIADDPDRPGAKKIELTTRTNAESKKLALPKEFVP